MVDDKKNLPRETAAPGERANRWSLGLSLLLHTILILFLFWLIKPPGTVGGAENERRVSVVLATATDDSKKQYLDESDIEQQVQPDSQPPSAAQSASAADSPPPAIDLPELDNLVGPITPTNPVDISADQMAVAQKSNFKAEFQLSEEDLKMIARDQRLIKSRQPVGKAATLSVFGTGDLEGHKFVFVVDRSQSMGADGLGVLSRARRELRMAVDQLKENHSFQVIAYNDRTSTILRRALLPATTENKRMVPEFMGNLAAYGPTSHQSGLIGALAFRPDVVVFMTDGGYPELNQSQLKTVRQMAGNKTQIHCIQFGSGPLQNRDNFMNRLSQQTGGSFRYINVNGWK